MNLYLALEYKQSNSITGAIKKSAKPELEKLKPYDNLSNEQVVEILETIKDLLPKAKLGLIERLLSSDDNSTNTSDLESSKPKVLPKGKDTTILQSICDNLEKRPLTNETKCDIMSISEIMKDLGMILGTDIYTKFFYRINNILDIDLAKPQAIKTKKCSDDTYFRDKNTIVSYCVMNNKYNSITVEQMLFIIKNPYMFVLNGRIYPCNTGAYGVNIFGHDYKYTTFERLDKLEKDLKKMLTKK